MISKITKECHQMFIIRRHRFRSNMSLQDFQILMLCELVQSFSNWCLKGLMDPKWHLANENNCFMFLVQKNDSIKHITKQSMTGCWLFCGISICCERDKMMSLQILKMWTRMIQLLQQGWEWKADQGAWERNILMPPYETYTLSELG